MESFKNSLISIKITGGKLKNVIYRARKKGDELKVFLRFYLTLVCSRFDYSSASSPIEVETLMRPDSVFWIVPWGVTEESPFELTPEFIETYRSFTKIDPGKENVFYYDLNEMQTDQFKLAKKMNLEKSVCFFLYGPNVGLAPSTSSLRKLINDLKSICSDIVLICIMTDVHLKRHELFIHNLGITWDALISLCRLPKLTSRYNQVLGPSISPVGFDKARKIENWMIQTERSAKVAICGTRYANRIELANKFKAKGLPFLLIGGEYGSKRLTDEEYWRKQMSCSIQVCLLDSYTGIGFHLKGHFSESLIAGCLTIVNNREIIPQEFREGIHYLYSPTLEGITSLVDDILSGRSEVDINAIALQGRKRYLELAHSSNYWNHILTNNLP